jgi:hypothetical protein
MVGTSPRYQTAVGWLEFGRRQGGMAAGRRSSMAACYRLGESELKVGMAAARNGGVVTPFYNSGEGEERTRGRRSSGGRRRFGGLQWGDVFCALDTA